MQRLSVGVRRVTVLTHIRAGGEWNAAPTMNAHNEIFTVILLQCKFQSMPVTVLYTFAIHATMKPFSIFFYLV